MLSLKRSFIDELLVVCQCRGLAACIIMLLLKLNLNYDPDSGICTHLFMEEEDLLV